MPPFVDLWYRCSMQIFQNARETQTLLDEPCAFVPTMGALHEGHLSLLRLAKGTGLKPVISIFLNPTQFAENEDLETYPVDVDRDLHLASEAGAEIVFMPDVETMYPEGLERATLQAGKVPLPEVAIRPELEDAERPHFFGGVCLVVGRLLDMVRPGIALFGEKDYQQLRVITEMVALDPNRFGEMTITGCPTIREPDGLAMSSRNVHLTPDQREQALGLSRALERAGHAMRVDEAEQLMRETLLEHELHIEYATVRHARTLEGVNSLDQPCRALIAARVGDVRLIDNAPIGRT